MKGIQHLVSPNSVLWTTNRMKDYAEDLIRDVDSWQKDTDKKEREAAFECKTCFYLRSQRVGGASCTEWPCGLCGETQGSGSIHTDKLCKTCAKEYQLCKYCGGDIKLRVRRMPELPQAKKVVSCYFCDEFTYEFEIIQHKYCCPKCKPLPLGNI